MSVLRIYKPDECSADGIPLDFECCRNCKGSGEGRVRETADMPWERCITCGGHGSLKAAAMHELLWVGGPGGLRLPPRAPHPPRCESCSHPMSEGTWEREGSPLVPYGEAGLWAISERMWLEAMRDEHEDRPYQPVHYSACDSFCDHGGPGRLQVPGCGTFETVADLRGWVRDDAQASWRPVDIRVGMVARRTLGDRFDPSNMLQVRPFDLARDNVAVLCLRCWAERSAA